MDEEILQTVTNDSQISDGETNSGQTSDTEEKKDSTAEAASSKEAGETEKFRSNYGFFGPITLLYACFYTFCMYKNASGVTFPFFVAGSLAYLYFSFSKLEITLKKGSIFYMAVMQLLAISTFCTADPTLIFFNKLGIFLLVISILLNQFCNTEAWGLGKFMSSILQAIFGALSQMASPFEDAVPFFRNRQDKKITNILAVGVGILIGAPLLLAVLALLSSADVFFRQLTDGLWGNLNLADGIFVIVRTLLMFIAAYGLFAYLCKKHINEEVEDKRNGNALIAITITGMLTAIYVLFSGIQIFGLFLGKLTLPAGYTYAQYAREGFFQLLFVGMLNLVIVLACLHWFRSNGLLKGILTVMSLCTFIMNLSSAMRMLLYIKTYDLSYLRILVLWGLALLTVLFIGVVITIFKEDFKLFRYSVAVVSVLYLGLSFAHPDYIIADYNLSKDGQVREMTADGPVYYKVDYGYLSDLSADAAPVIIPYMLNNGYVKDDMVNRYLALARTISYHQKEGFGYRFISNNFPEAKKMGIRSFNLSRYRLKQLMN